MRQGWVLIGHQGWKSITEHADRNRRVRNRTHGGVGGRRGRPRLLPDSLFIVAINNRPKPTVSNGSPQCRHKQNHYPTQFHLDNSYFHWLEFLGYQYEWYLLPYAVFRFLRGPGPWCLYPQCHCSLYAFFPVYIYLLR
ncbi:hypothetical protein Gura_1230 [Geotalea uraniireducens Rf4]|uniref:Uncharacterized protein n=1 Tax=Geotalea uraniireducens (strain Rf4) TaxID=351605 RepID=A5GAG5_GEOUR|nr:hypothetical protein Gura_1230 [Geotalea uraniireducens Rf4]